VLSNERSRALQCLSYAACRVLRAAPMLRSYCGAVPHRERLVGNSECAGINRHVVGDERALQERRTATPSWPRVLQGAP